MTLAHIWNSDDASSSEIAGGSFLGFYNVLDKEHFDRQYNVNCWWSTHDVFFQYSGLFSHFFHRVKIASQSNIFYK